jgi:voltage-gated potassium channel
MPADDESLEQRLPGYRFGVVLGLLFATFVIMAVAPSGQWGRVVIVGLQGLTLIAAFSASRVGRHLMRIGVVVATLAFVGALLAAITDAQADPGIFLVLSFLLVGAAPVVVGRSIWRRGVVDVKTVLGALCIYVMIGMLFAFVYGAIAAFSTDGFFAQTAHATTSDFLYFSFVTQTTTGYGDLTAAGDLGRALAVFEALFGQLYLVTIVAVLVSRLATQGHIDRTRSG